MRRISLSCLLAAFLFLDPLGHTETKSPMAVTTDPRANLTPAVPTVEPVAPALLGGAFIQYQSWMMDLAPKDWTNEMEAMKKAKINTVFLQWTQYNSQRFFTVNYGGYDPTETLMTYADTAGMKVFVGVRFDDEWWSKWYRDDWLSSTALGDLKFAQVLWKRYGQHPSFAGWYIPYELSDGDFDDSQISSFNIFFRKLATGLKRLSKPSMPVAVSTFFRGALSPDTVYGMYDKIFSNTGLDILMPQDGVGANSWAGSVADKAQPWLDAFLRVGKKNGIKVWPILEAFQTVHLEPQKEEQRLPAPITQLEEQFSTREPGMEQFVAFDFFHYMSPYRGDAQKALYDAYLKECVEQNGCPVPQ